MLRNSDTFSSTTLRGTFDISFSTSIRHKKLLASEQFLHYIVSRLAAHAVSSTGHA